MLFMIIEHFAGGDPAPVYARFAERGRMAPEGLAYHASCVTSDLTRCYQVMECDDRALLDEWMARWADLVRFAVGAPHVAVGEVAISMYDAELAARAPRRLAMRDGRLAGDPADGVALLSPV